MLISHSAKFVFVHVPKTGGTSILGALAQFGTRWKEGTVIKDVKGWQMKHHRHGMHSGLDSHPKLREELADYHFFGFIRNPWDRIISIYAKIGKALSLKEFLEALKRFPDAPANEKMEKTHYIHYQPKPLHTWLEIDGKTAVDFIGRYETLEDDFIQVQWDIGIREPVALPHYNPGRHKPYQEYYDAATKKMVAEMYAADIERYGYEFDA